MRIIFKHLRSLFAIAVALSIAGCVPKKIVWSPDGKAAVVLTEAGLYLTDGEGRLSDLLVSNVTTVAWFSDSQRIALSRHFKYSNWKDLSLVLRPDQHDRIIKSAENVVLGLKAGRPWNELNDELGRQQNLNEEEVNAMRLYLRDEQASIASTAVASDKESWNQVKVELGVLQLAKVIDQKVELGAVLGRETAALAEVRIAPNQKSIAYTTYSSVTNDKNYKTKLFVTETDLSAAPRLVEEQAGLYPDWSPDGRSLLYTRSTGNRSNNDELGLGILTRREVVNAAGKVEIKSPGEDLAGLMYSEWTRVRALKDGRILFASAEIHLPTTALDLPQKQQLFALDLERQATITALIPQSVQEFLSGDLSFFEVSPDEKKISIGSAKSEVAIFTLASGKVEILQPPAEDADLKTVPVWRSADELCYVMRARADKEQSQIVLWKTGHTNVLSGNWPDRMMKEFR